MTNRGLNDLGEDVTGFGRIEARTVLHTLTRPARLLDAYMTQGATGGGLYSRPLKLYLALNGVLMAMIFLMGGSDNQLARQLPPDILTPMLVASGKSRDAFLADADGWMTFLLVPVGAAAYALAVMPLLRWWDPQDLGWRRGFRAAFAYLNVWTVPMMPIAWMLYAPGLEFVVLPIVFIAAMVAFVRAGRGRWWRTPLGAVGKAFVIALALQAAIFLAGIPLGVLTMLGAVYGR